MCGRYTLETSWAEVHAFMQPIELLLPSEQPEARFNIAPSQQGLVLRYDAGAVRAESMRWGLLPAWAKDTRLAYSTINARAESMASKPAFRSAFRQRRCLVLASGYYEWPGEGKHKQPHFIHPTEQPLFAFAGLWEPPPRHLDPELSASYSIVTVAATESLSALHDRMPLLLQNEQMLRWMTAASTEAEQLAASAPTVGVAWHAVDRAVGNVRNQGPQLCRPLPGSN